MNDRDWAAYLAEQIRRAITWEHLPRTKIPGHIPPKTARDPGMCECRDQIRNTCQMKILQAAFNSYADAHPEQFPVI